MQLKAQLREILGKKVQKLREEGLIPAELYGKGIKNEHLSVSVADFETVLKEAGESTVVDLEVEGKKHPVLIYKVDYDHFKESYRTVDFYEVNMTEKVTTNIPLEFEGESPAVKEENGLLIKVETEIEVTALPADLPHNISVDLSILKNIGDNIHMSDLKIPAGVEVTGDMEAMIATISEQREEEVVEEKTTEEQVAEVKVEGEDKKEANSPAGEGEATNDKKE